MDKRIVYGYFYGKPLCFDGCVTEKCRTWPHGNVCGDCKEYALVSPADLAALEAQLAEFKATCGASFAETLEAIVKNDTNYDARSGLVLRAMSLAQAYGLATGMRLDPQEPEWPVVYIELPTGQVSWHLPQHPKEWDGHTNEQKFDRMGRFVALLKSQSESWSEAQRLSQTPEVKREAEYAKIGRVFLDWWTSPGIQECLHARNFIQLNDLADTIAKALEATDQRSPDAPLPSIDHMAGIAPGLKTITEVAEDYERVGRAVEEWQKREAAVMATMGSRGWREAISTLGEVIAQVKAGEKP